MRRNLSFKLFPLLIGVGRRLVNIVQGALKIHVKTVDTEFWNRNLIDLPLCNLCHCFCPDEDHHPS